MNPARELDGYLNWIEKAEEIILADEGNDVNDKAAYEVRRQHMRNSDNFPISSDSEECMSEFGGNAFSKGKGSSTQMGWFYRKERRLRLKIRHLIKSSYFYWTILILIFMNTVFMCSVHHNQPDYWERFLFYAEFVFLGFFGVELFLKVIFRK